MASIKDVAKSAGVGVGTVSRVINNIPVKDSTRQKVMNAIAKLDYVPNEVARNFKMQTSNIIALVLPNIDHPYFSKIAYYVEDELDKNGYKLMLCNSGGKPEKELYYLDMLNQNKVAGILGISYNSINWGLSSDIPMVSIDRKFESNIVCVTSDNYQGGKIAAEELIRCGCKKIAFIGAYCTVTTETGKRKKGFIHEAEKEGISYSVFEGLDPIKDEYSFVGEFVQKNPDVDGVFAITDYLAANLIKYLVKVGKCVPKDLKVIGYDGIQDSDLFHPVLSTICQPIEAMSRESVKTLLHIIKFGETDESTLIIPVTFRKGETTI